MSGTGEAPGDSGEALAAVSVDGRIADDVIARLRGLRDVVDARQVDLG